jgi:hypothetical protein
MMILQDIKENHAREYELWENGSANRLASLSPNGMPGPHVIVNIRLKSQSGIVGFLVTLEG